MSCIQCVCVCVCVCGLNSVQYSLITLVQYAILSIGLELIE